MPENEIDQQGLEHILRNCCLVYCIEWEAQKAIDGVFARSPAFPDAKSKSMRLYFGNPVRGRCTWSQP
ncbi:hypothetical protein [Herbaspirillum sp. RV1423]|uniref:hypothetical protein n=1 Tax=Herbaspirillum sp. RV1423 TaxID=1443993 RepID=UPI0012DF5665|nr:hypothetical protein [Herbaspirillum sp. RV1423]